MITRHQRHRTTLILTGVLLVGALAATAGGGRGPRGFGLDIGTFGRRGGNAGKTMNLLQKGSKTVQKVSEEIDPEQAYYIGRAVSARILDRYGYCADEEAIRYVNQVGRSLAEFSKAPEVFAGYHFGVLDSNEINAFAAPGAFVFITRGMLRCCQSEDELAAVLAHEIAHVQNHHAIKAIKQGQKVEAITTIGMEAAKQSGKGDVAKFTNLFGDVVGDIAKTLLTSGYSRDQEMAADRDGVEILSRTGYDPHAMLTMLGRMAQRLEPGRRDFASTHPSPQARIENVRKLIGQRAALPTAKRRDARFAAALASARSETDPTALSSGN